MSTTINRINTKEAIHEIWKIQDLLISQMEYITELLRAMNCDRRMLTRTPQEEAHRIKVVKNRNVGKLVSSLKVLYTTKKYAY